MSEAGEPPARPFPRPDPALAAFVVPALLLALLDGRGAGLVVATAGLAGATVLVRHPRLPALAGLAELPLALATLGLPALGAGASWPLALLAGAGGVGLLGWLGRTSGAPGGPGRLAAALGVPAVSLGLAAAIALSAPEISGSPGLAALLLFLALLVLAALATGSGVPPRGPTPSPGGPGGPSTA